MKHAAFGAVVLLAAMSAAIQAAPPAAGPLDFEKIIETAKQKVYPALVFVKPICKDLTSGEAKQQEVFGSGVIISPEGLVVTNNHVAEDAVTIRCVLGDKRLLEAKVVGLDPETDLALLKLVTEEDGERFPFAEFADDNALEAGQFVMALGAPFGFTRSISLGIISNTQRFLGEEEKFRYNNWLQTDAAINPGNSGGPLVNTEGKIVGINTLGIMGTGLGFSIPVGTVRRIAAQLEKDGKVVRAWTGINLQPLRDFETNTFIAGEAGVLVREVEKRSPAAAAGLHDGDLILEINGAPATGLYVEQLPDLYQTLADLPIGKPATFCFRRGEQTSLIQITPTLKGQFKGDEFDVARWNMTVRQISQFANPQLYFHRKQGVFIVGVRSPGNARSAGLQPMDILTAIDRKPVNSLEDFKQLYEELLTREDSKKKALVEVLRNGYLHMVVLDYRRDYLEEEKQ
jgi:serine protease Do